MSISVLGAGAFGTGLAIALAKTQPVCLWGRDHEHVTQMQNTAMNTRRLGAFPFPDRLSISADLKQATENTTLLLAIPMQKLADFLQQNVTCLSGKHLVACCKGIDRATGLGPVELIAQHAPTATPAILTGPSFASDIAQGLPTALTLACRDEDAGRQLQARLSTPSLRLYRTNDTTGAQLGGALKNVIAIASGAAIGAGFGESARAAVMTRGFAEINRFARHFGADTQTLAGLSGFGDLVLTCTSQLSRNYQFGLALGENKTFDKTITVEGAATAFAVMDLCLAHALEMPITKCITEVLNQETTVHHAMQSLLSRPLKEE